MTTAARDRAPVDPCPCCAVDLGGRRGATRRRTFLDGLPGILWGCPECGGRWRTEQSRPDRAAAG